MRVLHAAVWIIGGFSGGKPCIATRNIIAASSFSGTPFLLVTPCIAWSVHSVVAGLCQTSMATNMQRGAAVFIPYEVSIKLSKFNSRTNASTYPVILDQVHGFVRKLIFAKRRYEQFL